MRKIFVVVLTYSLLLIPYYLFSQVASSDEMLVPKKVGTDEMIPVFASDIASGEYTVEAESSSSMFRIAEARIFVSEGESGAKSMNAKITLGGKSYTKLFLGEAVEAASSGGNGEILPLRYAQGQNDSENQNNAPVVFEFPISALNEPIKCAAFSKNKSKWYDRDILFDAAQIPEEKIFVSPTKPQKILLKDGTYSVAVTLSGGSGKASVKSPALVTVKDGFATAEIEWGSANYDYMKVNRERYDVDKKILDDGGNSTFTIPIYAFNKKMPVFADTLAMSRPHEILYFLEFDLDSAKKENSLPTDALLLIWAALVVGGVIFARFKMLGKKKS